MPPSPSWLERLAARTIPAESAGADRQKRLYLALVFVLFVPTAAVFAWNDWVAGSRTVAYLVTGVMIILLSSIQILRRAQDIRSGYRIVVGSVVALMTGVVYVGGGGGYAIIWFYMFPGAMYYLFGSREGTLWVALSLALPGVVLFTQVGFEYPSALAGRFVVTYALVSALALGLQRARDALYAELAHEKERLEEAVAKVRTLSEMLPMCAWCGKVRDDEGYWSRIEEYLQQETGTLVSHGICEECVRRLDADPEHRGRAGAPGTTPGDGAPAGGGEAP